MADVGEVIVKQVLVTIRGQHVSLTIDETLELADRLKEMLNTTYRDRYVISKVEPTYYKYFGPVYKDKTDLPPEDRIWCDNFGYLNLGRIGG